MRKQRFQIGVAGTLRLEPREGPPKASSPSPTCALYSREGALLAAPATPSASLAVQTTLTAVMAAGSRVAAVASVASIKTGMRLWLGAVDYAASPAVQQEPFEQLTVRSIVSLNVTFAEVCRYEHKSGGQVSSSEILATLSAVDQLAVLGQNQRAVWTYTVATEALSATQLWDVVAQVFRLPLTPDELVLPLSESLRKSLPDVAQIQELVVEAEDWILGQVEQRGLNPDRIRGPEQWRQVGKMCCLEILLDRARQSDPTFRQAWLDSVLQRDRAFDEVVKSIQWVDADEDLVVDGPGVDDSGEETGQGEEGQALPMYFQLG